MTRPKIILISSTVVVLSLLLFLYFNNFFKFNADENNQTRTDATTISGQASITFQDGDGNIFSESSSILKIAKNPTKVSSSANINANTNSHSQSTNQNTNISANLTQNTNAEAVVSQNPANTNSANANSAIQNSNSNSSAAPATTVNNQPISIAQAPAATTNLSKSKIVFDKTSANADGRDAICLQITLINQDDSTNLVVRPLVSVVGGADLGTLILRDQKWNSCLASTAVGNKNITISAAGSIIGERAVNFVLPVDVVQQLKLEDAITSTITQQQVLDLKAASIVAGPISTASKAKVITNNDYLTISGTGTPDTTIRVTIHSPETIEKTVTVDSLGQWSLTLDQQLSAGDHSVEIVAFDKYGNQSTSQTISRFSVSKHTSKPIIISIIIGTLIIAIFAYLLTKKRRFQPYSQPISYPPAY